MEVGAFAAQESFHRACPVCMAVAEVIDVTLHPGSFASGGFAGFGSSGFPHGLKSFSRAGFSFCGHNLAAAATAGMMERQTKFRRYDVNGQGRRAAPTE